MPEYTLAGLVTVGAAVAAAWVTGVARIRATWIGFAIFLALTLMFDLVLTALPIVSYGDSLRSGVGIATIPIEDLLYGQALYLVAVSAWGPAPAGRTAGRTA